MSPQGRKRAALMISRDQPASIGSSYQTYRKVNVRKCLILILSTEKILKIEYLKFTRKREGERERERIHVQRMSFD